MSTSYFRALLPLRSACATRAPRRSAGRALVSRAPPPTIDHTAYRLGLVGSNERGAYNALMTDIGENLKDPLLAAVGERIRTLREFRRLSPKDFAAAAGFSLSYLWRLETGQQNVNLKTISRVALALGEPMSALLEGIDPDPATLEPRPYVHKAVKASKAAKG